MTRFVPVTDSADISELRSDGVNGASVRPIRIATAPNFRDFGGHAPCNGGRVRKGLLYRSEAIVDPTVPDTVMLAGIGMMLVCDLRGYSEREHLPNFWWSGEATECIDLDILGGLPGKTRMWETLRADPSADAARAMMLGVYRGLPRAAAPHLSRIFARMADGDLPLLIHCTAGKDRTGFVCAMILSALGVETDAIMADYLVTNDRISDRVRAATARFAGENLRCDVPKHALDALVSVVPEFLAASLEAIDESFGSVHSYLEREAGLDAARLRALHDRLVDSRGPPRNKNTAHGQAGSGANRHEL